MLKRIDENLLLVSPGFEKQKQYWMNKLAAAVEVTEFPIDTDKAGHDSQKKRKQTGISLPHGLCSRLIKLSKKSDLSLYMVLLTGIKFLIYYYTGNWDISVLSPLYHPNITELTINNCLIIRDTVNRSHTFIETLLKIRQSVLEAYENQDYPFNKLKEALNDRSSIQPEKSYSHVLCCLRNIHTHSNIDALDEKFTFLFCREQDRITGSISYDSNMYTGRFTGQLSRHLVKILENGVEDIKIKLSDISFLSEEEKKCLLYEFNDTETGYPRSKTIHRLFEEQAGKTRNNIAVVCNHRQLTYGELNERGNRLSRKLKAKGTKPESILGIMSFRSLEMIVGILGILKAGCAYLPVDPDYPEERIKYMLEDSQVGILLTQTQIIEKHIFNGENIQLNDRSLYALNPGTAGTGENMEHNDKPGELAYIMYTSGSTGRAKGVLVEHGNVVRLVVETTFIKLTTKTRILQTGAPVFDAATFEIWGALLNGGRLYLVDDEVILDAHRLGRALVQNKITTMWLTSPLFNQLSTENLDIFMPLKHLLVGGDVLSPTHIKQVRNKNKKLKILNGYGPTENTTFSAVFSIDRDYEDTIPIGSPISNSTAYILNKNGGLLPIGVFGELCVGGDGVSRGYLNSPESTREKFVEDPFQKGKRVYLTGDIARWLPGGNIEFQGRRDNQVKIRGFRIEPGEIESQLLKHQDVGQAVVLTKEEKSGNKYLCAYIAANSDKEIPAAQLREHLLTHLPEYMVPSYFIFMSQIPLTPNGKIDRKALPEPGMKAGQGYVAPGNELEKTLVEIWSEVLGIEKDIIGIDTNFFELGGHSLKVTIMSAQIHKELDIKIPLAEIFNTPTIKGIASLIDVIRWAGNKKTDSNQKMEEIIL
jgi:amino acid adenylation domain-containing protein